MAPAYRRYHNQRLEFLGDAVLEFLSSHHLFGLFRYSSTRLIRQHCQHAAHSVLAVYRYSEEGRLTDYRSGVVNNALLSGFAARLGLQGLVLLGELTAERVQWVDSPDAYEKMLADSLEALFGAIYLDQGLAPCRHLLAQARASSYARDPCYLTRRPAAPALLEQIIFPARADLPLRRIWLHSVKQEYVGNEPVERDAADENHQALMQFEAEVGVTFSRFGLLQQAFTHPSYFMQRAGYVPPVMPPGQGYPHNQRLEWIGDAVPQLASSDLFCLDFC